VTEQWPPLPLADWQDTKDTLHLWTQIVGKVRLELEPMTNHWWNVPLYVNSVGLTTSLMPYQGMGVEIVFDFIRHQLVIETSQGSSRQVALRPRTVADFFGEFEAQLAALGINVPIKATPVEIPTAIPFADDVEHDSYDAAAAHAFWISLVSAERVLGRFRAEFRGKVSPVHFFWGAFDLAVTRFSGRPAERHPGGVPNCPDWVMWEAYSDEVSSCGYWPDYDTEGAFYSYAYPDPPGFRTHPVQPGEARFDHALGEFVLPYADVRRAADPDQYLLSFLTSTFDAAASSAGWPTLPTTADPRRRARP
jgi:hypothetical protein